MLSPKARPYRPTVIQPMSRTVAYAKNLYRMRRRRDALLGDYFGEPAWDMLLDLFIAQHERRAVSVTSLCIAAAVPATTSLRWIRKMQDTEMLVRTDDWTDGRRSYITLSDTTSDRIAKILSDAIQAYPPALD